MRTSGAAAQRRAAASLARSSEEELHTAWAAFARLVITARVAVETTPLVDQTGPVWALARCLTDLPVTSLAAVHPAADLTGALVDALDSVRVCRQVVHAHGACWFTLDSGEDLCGDVLQLAHGLATTTRPDPS